MTDTRIAADSDAAEIRRLHREFVDANGPLDSSYLRRRATAVPDELVWFNLNGEVYIGQDQIVQLWDALSAAMRSPAVSAEMRDERIEVVGDVAWVSYLNHYQADFGDIGSYNAGMRSTEIWRRREGDWELVHAHFSTYLPTQAGER